MKIFLKRKMIFLMFAALFGFVLTAQAQTTAFNFQGRLNDGNNPANGHYDLEFRLYDAITGGNQVGATVAKSNLTLVNGVFSTQLDFGLMAFSGGNRFIEVGLRQTPANVANAVPNAFVTLGPRQQILSVPYSIRSLRSTLADDATHAVNADNATNAGNASYATTAGSANTATTATTAATAVNSQQLGGVAANQYVQQGSFRAVKAMIFFNPYLTANQQIVRCYNSQLSGAAATTAPCGFNVRSTTDDNTTIGHWAVTFGFDVRNSFFSLTTVTTKGNSGRRMTVSSIAGDFNGSGGDITYIGNGTGDGQAVGIEIVTKYTDDQSFTNDPFLLVVY